MKEEKKVTQVENPDDNNIVVESVEDDMKKLGIEVEDDKKDEPQQPTEEEQPVVKKKSRAQKRIEAQQRTIKELRRKLELTQQQENKQKPNEEVQNEDEELDIDDFDSYDDYLAALEDNDLGNKKVTKDEPKKDIKQNLLADKVEDVVNDGVDTYPDFIDIVQDPNLQLSQQLLERVVNDSDDAVDVLYYLGKNPEVSAKLSQMSNERIIKEIGKIELKLEEEENNNTKVKTSKAPEPINPVEGTAISPKSADDEDMSFEEYESVVKQQRMRSNGGFL